MKPTRVIFATFLAMVTVQTVASIDTRHRLPAPKKYAAIGVAWGILFLMVDVGLGKLASRLSLLMLLTGMVIGPFGTLTIKFLNTITNTFAIPPEQDSTGIPGTPGVPGVPGTPGVTPINSGQGRLA
jgi:hypothetical protein